MEGEEDGTMGASRDNRGADPVAAEIRSGNQTEGVVEPPLTPSPQDEIGNKYEGANSDYYKGWKKAITSPDEIGGLVEEAWSRVDKTYDTSKCGNPDHVLIAKLAAALERMAKERGINEAIHKAALQAAVTLRERVELCEGFELRHRQQIGVLLGEKRIRDIALEEAQETIAALREAFRNSETYNRELELYREECERRNREAQAEIAALRALALELERLRANDANQLDALRAENERLKEDIAGYAYNLDDRLYRTAWHMVKSLQACARAALANISGRVKMTFSIDDRVVEIVNLIREGKIAQVYKTLEAVRDKAHAEGYAKAEAAVGALRSLKWKSVDRDNMEFACRITCFQMDKIKAVLANIGEGKE